MSLELYAGANCYNRIRAEEFSSEYRANHMSVNEYSYEYLVNRMSVEEYSVEYWTIGMWLEEYAVRDCFNKMTLVFVAAFVSLLQCAKLKMLYMFLNRRGIMSSVSY